MIIDVKNKSLINTAKNKMCVYVCVCVWGELRGMGTSAPS